MIESYMIGLKSLIDNFGHIPVKDPITATIGLAAFITSATNVWVAYLRSHVLECDLSDALRFGYGPRPEHLLMLRVDVFALNKGARPGVITRMSAAIKEKGSDEPPTYLHWTEVTKSENIAARGEPRKVFTDFAGFATPFLIPKYDARLVESAFWCESTYELEAGKTYILRLHCWVAGQKKQILGSEREFHIDERLYSFLQTKASTGENGLRERHLYMVANDGKTYIAPVSTANIKQGEVRALPDTVKLKETP